MEEEKAFKRKIGGRGIIDYIPEHDEQIVSACFRVPANKSVQEKVTSMVGTFLSDDSSVTAKRWFSYTSHSGGI